ncbi:MAG: hypothetical protein HC828_08845 [Blastochloris sp.]|nr:hypothetical protein [Blastochloris sp.]
MATFQNQTYANQSLDVDDNRYVGCTFINCTLNYRGGELPLFDNCVFRGGSIQLAGAAAQTVRYLSGLHRGGLAEDVDFVLTEVGRGNRD